MCGFWDCGVSAFRGGCGWGIVALDFGWVCWGLSGLFVFCGFVVVGDGLLVICQFPGVSGGGCFCWRWFWVCVVFRVAVVGGLADALGG